MIRVIIADDQPLIRKGVKQILSETNDISLIKEYYDFKNLTDNIKSTKWDVALVDINMPNGNIFDFLNFIKLNKISKPLIVFSIYPEEQFAVRLLKEGAKGYLHKDCYLIL